MKYPEYQSIKSWAEDDRPREKLQLKGKSALSDAELLAILLGSGSRRESAVDLAKKVLHHYDGNLHQLGRLTIRDLCQFKGIGEAKAINIIAALELGRRQRLSKATRRRRIISSEHSFELLQPRLGDLTHEEFWVLFLSASNFLIGEQCISSGGWSSTLADQRPILREALYRQATGIIIAHNHPSGYCQPSGQDKRLTEKLKDACKVMDIYLLDHVIIAENHYFSFADEGLI